MSIIIIILVVIIVLIIINRMKNRNNKTFDNEVIKTNNHSTLYDKYKKYNINKVVNDQFFTTTQFHQDYIDVINSFNDYDGIAPHAKQLFNINNVPVIIKKNVDVDKVGQMVNDFIIEINKKIKQNSSIYDNATVDNWRNIKYKQKYKDGFQEVQKSLGLPETLYNDPIKETRVYLIQYSDITRYATENEMRYVVYVILGRELSRDQMLVKVNFIEDYKMPRNIIIENIDIIGFIAVRAVGLQYVDINNYYNFDSLEDNNMIDINKLMNELEYKRQIKTQLMQERIGDLHPDDKYTHMQIEPNKYQSFKNTRTIYEDIYGEKHFE